MCLPKCTVDFQYNLFFFLHRDEKADGTLIFSTSRCHTLRRKAGRCFATSAIMGQYLDNEFGGANPRIDIVGANQKRHLITHADHFYVPELCNLRKGFASLPENWPVFHVFGSEDIKTAGAEAFKITPEHLHQTPFQSFQAGELTITPLKAYHGTEHLYIYMI